MRNWKLKINKYMANLNTTIKQIKSIEIQGASNVAREAIKAWSLHLQGFKGKEVKNFLSEAEKTGKRLAHARPNEPLTVNALAILNRKLKEAIKIKKVKIDVVALKKFSRQYGQDLSALFHENGQKIANYGAGLIKNKDNIFTHCHSRNVINVFARAKEKGKKFHVYNDETRPLFQGQKTARDLALLKIPNIMVVDSAAAFLVSDISGDDVKIHKVFLGCDVVFPDGSAYNKIGSFGIALAAYTSKIPVYVAGSLLKFSNNQKMKIEIRQENEVWDGKPKNLKIINYSFGRIPAKFISGYITEAGIIKPTQIKHFFKKFYTIIKD